MKKTSLFVFLLLVTSVASAQTTDSKQPLFRVSSFSSSIGFAGNMSSNSESAYYGLQGAVENPDLFVDISGFSNTSSNNYYGGFYFNDFYVNSGSGNGSFVFNLGLTPYSKKLGKFRENRELRISVGSEWGTANYFNYYNNYDFPIDTFQSINGSGIVFADSVINSDYYYSLNYADINFGLSYIFKTDVKRTVHFYAGLGINYGIALNSSVNFDQSTYRSVYYYNQYQDPSDESYGFYYGNNSSYDFYSSSTELKGTMQFIKAYIPLGLSIRLSRKHESFFNHVNLYTELNPGVSIQVIPNDKSYASPYMGVAIIGWSYRW